MTLIIADGTSMAPMVGASCMDKRMVAPTARATTQGAMARCLATQPLEIIREALAVVVALVRPDPAQLDSRYLLYFFLSRAWRANEVAFTDERGRGGSAR